MDDVVASLMAPGSLPIIVDGLLHLAPITLPPIALGLWILSRCHGVQTAAWTLAVVTVIAGALLIGMALTRQVDATHDITAPQREQELAHV